MEYGSCHHGIVQLNKGVHETFEEMILTLSHEITHQTLTNQTVLGSIMMLLQLIIVHPSTSKDTARQLERIHKIILKNCIKVHECSAVFSELNIAKMYYPERFDELVSKYSNTQPYKNACDFKNRKWIFDYPFGFISSLILDIAKVSMNIQTSKLNILDKKLDKTLINQDLVDAINPNHRFKIMLRTLKDVLESYEISQSSNFDSIVDEDKRIKSITGVVLKESAMSYLKFEKFDLEEWYDTILRVEFELLNFSEYCECCPISDIGELTDVIVNTTYINDISREYGV